MESRPRRNLVAVLVNVAYVSVLPLLARVTRGPAWGGQHVDMNHGIPTFLLEMTYLSIFSSLAAPPLVVAWARREKQPVTWAVSFILTTFLLLFWHYHLNTLERYGQVSLAIIPIKTAVITSLVMLIVGLVEKSLWNKQRPSAPPVNRGTGKAPP